MTLPVYIIRRCRLNSCDRGQSPKCTHEEIDQSTVYDVDKVLSAAGRRVRVVPFYAVVFVETLELVHADTKNICQKLHYKNQYVTAMTARYTKFTKLVPTGRTTATHVVNSFFESWIIPYRISSYALTDDGFRFISILIATLCTMLVVQHLTTIS